ncbi:DUF4371 domain-containing protein [Aphis craccivora]|uniref:DUF4371 domain-containing protein n=1 Tax=Aphis craccivora TaxID=307492 RepID=A0A6G0WET9_APHCR|nr:DUF4371 domain-containing protein [Aphis craccivora]
MYGVRIIKIWSLITVSPSIVISFSSTQFAYCSCFIELKSTMFEIIEAIKDEKPKHRKQKYHCEWESDNLFKGWLKPEKNNSFRAKCNKYQVSFISELSSIKKHATSKAHENTDGCSTMMGSQNSMSS